MDKKGKYAIIGIVAAAMCMSCCCCSSLFFIGKNSEPKDSTETSESSIVETTKNTEVSTIEATTSIVTTTTIPVTSTAATIVETTEATTIVSENEDTTEETIASDTTLSPDSIIALINLALVNTPDNIQTDVSYEEEGNIYYIKVNTSGTAALATMAKSGTKVEEWNSVIDSMTDLCNTIYDTIKEFDPNVNVSVMVMNDLNPDNALLGIVNGVVLFDYGKAE